MYYLIAFVLAVAIFTVGFFVGKKNGSRVDGMEKRLKDTLGGK